MTERCDLCGRAMAKKMIVPAYYQHRPVCQRKRCRQAVRDAMNAVATVREQNDELVGEIAKRNESQTHPVGWRGDTMCEIQFEPGEWWANQVVQRV